MSTASDIASGLIEMAAQHPDRVAITSDSIALTFAELDARVGSVAAAVRREADSRAGTDGAFAGVVPVIVELNVDSVIAVHAMLRAGIAFAPLSASLPQVVIAGIRERLGQPELVVVASAGDLPIVPDGVGVLRVADASGPPIAPVQVGANATAAVLFTSGSSGHPKGVVYRRTEFDAIYQRHVRWQESNPFSSLVVISPLSWLAGLSDVLMSAVGWSLVLSEAAATDPARFFELLDREAVQQVVMTPSLVRAASSFWPAGRRLEHLELVSLVGEAVDWEHIELVRGLAGSGCEVYVSYGATEAAGAVLENRIGSTQVPGLGRVSSGFPTVEGRATLDFTGHENGVGELVVFGSVASGYLGDPELDESRFGVTAEGVRFWRSGDLFTLGADGAFQFHSRLDDLLKINGRLVEPAEPERALRAMDEIDHAVVLPHRMSVDRTLLVGHVVVAAGSDLTAAEVRSELESVLAPHLIPGLFMRHEVLPLTDRGKVDRAGLLAAPIIAWTSVQDRKPDWDFELFVTICAREILGFPGIGVDDDLWFWGLDSLAALELVEALAEVGLPTLDPGALLECRTPSAIASILSSGVPRTRADVVELGDRSTEAPMFCVPGAGGTAIGFFWLSEYFGEVTSLVVVEARGLQSSRKPDRTIGVMAERVVDAVQKRQPSGPVTIIGHSAGGVIGWEAAATLFRQGRTVRLVLLDGVFGASPTGDPGPAGWSASVESPPGLFRTVFRSPRRNLGGIRRRVRSRLIVRARNHSPGTDRFPEFYGIGRRAVGRHVASPGNFPVLNLHPVDSPYVGSVPPMPHGSLVIEVSGDHRTMLEPLNVAELARHIADFAGLVVPAAKGDRPTSSNQFPTIGSAAASRKASRP